MDRESVVVYGVWIFGDYIQAWYGGSTETKWVQWCVVWFIITSLSDDYLLLHDLFWLHFEAGWSEVYVVKGSIRLTLVIICDGLHIVESDGPSHSILPNAVSINRTLLGWESPILHQLLHVVLRASHTGQSLYIQLIRVVQVARIRRRWCPLISPIKRRAIVLTHKTCVVLANIQVAIF